MDQVTLDPSEFPTVALGGKTYPLKFTAGSIIRLKRNGIEVEQLKTATIVGSEAVTRIVALLQACAPGLSTLTVEQIGDMIDLDKLKVYADAVNEALKKVSPQATETSQAPAPAIQ